MCNQGLVDYASTFIQALSGEKLVSQLSLDKMRPENQQLGLGMMQFPFHDKTAYGHNGGIDGFQSNVAYFPEDDIAVALTGNALNYSLNEMLIGILSITFGRDFEIPTFHEISLTSTQKAQFPGHYSSDQLAMDIEIFIKNEQLFVQATGQPPLPLTASDTSTLQSDRVGLVLKFNSLSNSKYNKFTFKQRGVEASFFRKNK